LRRRALRFRRTLDLLLLLLLLRSWLRASLLASLCVPGIHELALRPPGLGRGRRKRQQGQEEGGDPQGHGHELL